MKGIDTQFDFTSDSPKYWAGFWERNEGLGGGGSDPDADSPMLQKFHQILWSRELPNVESMDLKRGTGSQYLVWKDFRFGSDSVCASFRYNRNRDFLTAVEMAIPNYREYVEAYLINFDR